MRRIAGLWLRLRDDRGVALFTAVWLTLAISVLAIGVARESRTTVAITANELAAARATQAAEAGLARLALTVLAEASGLTLPVNAEERAFVEGVEPLGQAPLPLDGRPVAWAYGEARVILRAEAERGKYDLNAGRPSMMARVLAVAGAAEPERLAERMLARRKRDLRRGVAWRLDDREITGLDILARLPGVDRGLLARLAPLVTVHSDLVDPDPSTAPAALYAALPLSEADRTLAEEARAARRNRTDGDPEAYTLRARAWLPDGTAAEASVVMEIDPGYDRPLRVIAKPAP